MDVLEQHRALDGLLGRLIRAIVGGDVMGALDAALSFQELLAEHTALEESALPPRTERKLVPNPEHTPAEAAARELRVEHLQLRELAAMIVHQLGERNDLAAARGLATSLADRWRSHTER